MSRLSVLSVVALCAAQSIDDNVAMLQRATSLSSNRASSDIDSSNVLHLPHNHVSMPDFHKMALKVHKESAASLSGAHVKVAKSDIPIAASADIELSAKKDAIASAGSKIEIGAEGATTANISENSDHHGVPKSIDDNVAMLQRVTSLSSNRASSDIDSSNVLHLPHNHMPDFRKMALKASHKESATSLSGAGSKIEIGAEGATTATISENSDHHGVPKYPHRGLPHVHHGPTPDSHNMLSTNKGATNIAAADSKIDMGARVGSSAATLVAQNGQKLPAYKHHGLPMFHNKHLPREVAPASRDTLLAAQSAQMTIEAKADVPDTAATFVVDKDETVVVDATTEQSSSKGSSVASQEREKVDSGADIDVGMAVPVTADAEVDAVGAENADLELDAKSEESSSKENRKESSAAYEGSAEVDSAVDDELDTSILATADAEVDAAVSQDAEIAVDVSLEGSDAGVDTAVLVTTDAEVDAIVTKDNGAEVDSSVEGSSTEDNVKASIDSAVDAGVDTAVLVTTDAEVDAIVIEDTGAKVDSGVEESTAEGNVEGTIDSAVDVGIDTAVADVEADATVDAGGDAVVGLCDESRLPAIHNSERGALIDMDDNTMAVAYACQVDYKMPSSDADNWFYMCDDATTDGWTCFSPVGGVARCLGDGEACAFKR